MSTPMGPRPAIDLKRALPDGEIVGRYRNYLDAQKAVDYLADQQFEVKYVSIVGNDLHTVERVTGRISYPGVALSGAVQGLILGLFVGVVFTLFGGSSPNFTSLLPTMAIGAALFMIISVIQYSLVRGKRDFMSVNTIVATTYDVVVERSVSARARALLEQLPMNSAMTIQPTAPQAPGTSGGTTGANGRPTGGDAPAAPPAHGSVPVPGNFAQPGSDAGAGSAGDGQGASAHAGSVAGSGDQGNGAQATNPAQDVPASAAPSKQYYPDLPDGRPMFGVRAPAPSSNEEPEASDSRAQDHNGQDHNGQNRNGQA